MRDTKESEGAPLDTYVRIELQYLPDFSEEYSLHVSPGLGMADVAIKLDQGWNLTAIDQDLDSNVDDNIRAIGEAAADLGSAFAATKTASGNGGGQEMVVRATNVPLGYYESVIGCGPNGRKQMYGWRYVGFAPFNACPTSISGGTHVCCDAPDGAVFGLAFENGVMVFRELQVVRDQGNTERVATTDLEADKEPRPVLPQPQLFDAANTLDEIKKFIQNHATLRRELGSFAVVVQPSWDRLDTVRVELQVTQPVDPARQDALRKELAQEATLMGLLRDVSPTALIEIIFSTRE
jgi:hypothetical protein